MPKNKKPKNSFGRKGIIPKLKCQQKGNKNVPKKIGLIKFESNSSFAARVLILSLPATLVFVMLTMMDLLSPYWALISYALIIVFNMIFLLPISFELQQVKKYINQLASGDTSNVGISLSEQEAREIADAVNSMHRFWVDKADALEAQAMSDTAVLDTLPDPVLMIDRVWANADLLPWTYDAYQSVYLHSHIGRWSGSTSLHMNGYKSYIGEIKFDYVNVVFSDGTYVRFDVKTDPKWLLAKEGDRVRVIYTPHINYTCPPNVHDVQDEQALFVETYNPLFN